MNTNRINIQSLFRRSLLFALLVGALTTGCKREQELLFDKPGNARALDLLDNLEKTLLANPNGWEMVYKVPNEEVKGEFTIQMQFGENKSVKMWSDFLEAPTTSTYALSMYSGPMLSFDTPGALTELADPANVPSQDVKRGNGYYGENDFIIMSVAPEKIVLRGLKYGKDVTLTPLDHPADLTNKGVKKLLYTAANRMLMFGDARALVVNGEKKNKVTFAIPELGRFISSVAELPAFGMTLMPMAEGEKELEFVVTPTEAGFTLSPALQADGKGYTEFVFDEKGKRFFAKDNDKVYINLLAQSELTSKLMTGVYANGFFISGMSPKMQEVITAETMQKFFPGEYKTIQWYNMPDLKSVSVMMKGEDGKNKWHDLYVMLDVVDDSKALYRMVTYQEGIVSSQEMINALLDQDFAGIRAFAICFTNVLMSTSQFYIEEIVPDQKIRFTWAAQNGEYWVEFQRFDE